MEQHSDHYCIDLCTTMIKTIHETSHNRKTNIINYVGRKTAERPEKTCANDHDGKRKWKSQTIALMATRRAERIGGFATFVVTKAHLYVGSQLALKFIIIMAHVNKSVLTEIGIIKAAPFSCTNSPICLSRHATWTISTTSQTRLNCMF